jgi:hypothetical protein
MVLIAFYDQTSADSGICKLLMTVTALYSLNIVTSPVGKAVRQWKDIALSVYRSTVGERIPSWKRHTSSQRGSRPSLVEQLP